MSREAWLICCTGDEGKSGEAVVATKENSLCICAAKPLEYFLLEREKLVHQLGKAVRFEIRGYQHEDSDGVISPLDDTLVESSFKNDDVDGKPWTYVRAGDIKPMLHDFNQDCDGPAARYIAELPDDTVLVLCWL